MSRSKTLYKTMALTVRPSQERVTKHNSLIPMGGLRKPDKITTGRRNKQIVESNLSAQETTRGNTALTFNIEKESLLLKLTLVFRVERFLDSRLSPTHRTFVAHNHIKCGTLCFISSCDFHAQCISDAQQLMAIPLSAAKRDCRTTLCVV